MSRARFIRGLILATHGETRATMAEIVRSVAVDSAVPAVDIVGRDKIQRIAHARQEVMRRASVISGITKSEIGRFFSFDHTTIIHGIEAATGRLGQ